MLQIEILKFQAQDIITASVADPVCRCSDQCAIIVPGSIHHDKPATCSCELPDSANHDKIKQFDDVYN